MFLETVIIYVLPQCNLSVFKRSFIGVFLRYSLDLDIGYYHCNLGFIFQLFSLISNHARLLCVFLIKYEYEYYKLYHILADRNAHRMIDSWHHNVVCLTNRASCVVIIMERSI